MFSIRTYFPQRQSAKLMPSEGALKKNSWASRRSRPSDAFRIGFSWSADKGDSSSLGRRRRRRRSQANKQFDSLSLVCHTLGLKTTGMPLVIGLLDIVTDSWCTDGAFHGLGVGVILVIGRLVGRATSMVVSWISVPPQSPTARRSSSTCDRESRDAVPTWCHEKLWSVCGHRHGDTTIIGIIVVATGGVKWCDIQFLTVEIVWITWRGLFALFDPFGSIPSGADPSGLRCPRSKSLSQEKVAGKAKGLRERSGCGLLDLTSVESA